MSAPMSVRVAVIVAGGLLVVNLFSTVRVSLLVVSFEVPLVVVVMVVAVAALWARRVWREAMRVEWARRERERAETKRLLARPIGGSGRLARSTFDD